MTITDYQETQLNKMNRASQNVLLGTIIQDLQNTTGSMVNGSRKNISVSDSPYTLLPTDQTLRCNATTGSIVIKLFATTSSGKIFNIKNLYTSACLVRVIADTSGTPDLIDGQSTIDLSAGNNMSIQDGAINYWDIL